MYCLKGYIGLSASIKVVDSGLYLNALPGITFSSIMGIVDDEQKDYDGLMIDIEARAIPKFRTFFTRELNSCFRLSKREIVECLICENRELLAVSLWYLMGSELMVEKIRSERTNRFTTVNKKDNQELSNEFMETFFTELGVAVAGIDINSSLCIAHDEIECNNILKVIYTQP